MTLLLILRDDVLQYFYNLLRCSRPSHRRRIHFLEWMNYVIIMQSNVGCAHRRTITRIKSRIPLLVFIAKSNDRDIALFNEVFNSYGIHLG